jgi:TPR repeat protein
MLQRNNEEAELEAFLLLQKGAECGDSASIYLLAEAYETGKAFANGKRLPADAEKAQMYYNLAEKSD